MQSRHGKSIDDYRVETMARDFYRSFQTLCPNKTVLVGNSLGGWIALRMALDYPEFVDHVLALSPAGLKMDYQGVVGVFLDPSVANIRNFRHKAYHDDTPIPDFGYKSLRRRLLGIPLVDILKGLEREGFFDEKAKNITVPVTLMWGESDEIIPESLVKKYHQLIPNSEYIKVKECGHLTHKEALAQVFDQLQSIARKVSDQNAESESN